MLRALAFSALALVSFPAAQAQDAAKAQQIASQVCAACHGIDGNSVAAANPKIAGQIPEYLHKQLANFKGVGERPPLRESPIMTPIVANLSEADMKNLAAYYAAQEFKPAVAVDKDLAALGQKIWRAGNPVTGVPACAGCHGPTGIGIPAQYPRLSGQFAEYLAAQLRLFRDGERNNDPNGMMRGVASRMTEREIRAVSEYAAGLR